MNKFILISIFLFSSLSKASSSEGGKSAAQKFWKKFRIAVHSNNTPKIISLTNFPFEVKGALDSDPVKKLSKDEFRNQWKSFLEKDSGMTADGLSMRKLIKKMINIKKPKGKEFVVGNFSFQKINKKWKWVKVTK